MRKFVSTIVTASVVVGIASAVSFTAATPAFADSNGNCGGHASSVSQAYNGWNRNHVVTKAANVALKPTGYALVDGSAKSYMNERVEIAQTTKVSRTHNYGCRSGKLFSAGTKTLPVGHKVGFALPANYDKSTMSGTSKKGWVKKVIKVHIVFDTGCSNPHSGWIYVTVWVKPKPKPKTCPKGYTGKYPHCTKPKPPKPPVSKPSFSCTGLSATPNGGQYGLNYTFAVSATVKNTRITGSKYTVLSNGNVIATPASNTLSTPYNFPQAGTYMVEGQVITSAGTAPAKPTSTTCATTVTITKPPAPPVTHTTSISCQLQEEITGGDASETYCTVVSDVSVPSTINVTTSDSSQLYVTGIECTDNTTASCDGSPGHYSFVLHGINDGTSPIFPTLTVSATANGVTTKPPFQATVRVDPSSISFGANQSQSVEHQRQLIRT